MVAGMVAVALVMESGGTGVPRKVWRRAEFHASIRGGLIDENRKGSGEAPGTKDLFHTLRPRAKDFCLVSGHISYSNLAGRHADCA